MSTNHKTVRIPVVHSVSSTSTWNKKLSFSIKCHTISYISSVCSCFSISLWRFKFFASTYSREIRTGKKIYSMSKQYQISFKKRNKFISGSFVSFLLLNSVFNFLNPFHFPYLYLFLSWSVSSEYSHKGPWHNYEKKFQDDILGKILLIPVYFPL